MSLSPLAIACAPFARLAIAGTAKNAGKTTVLNHLVAQYHAQGERLALTSVGRDGEAIDQVTNQPKPRIHPPVGTWVATAEEAAGASRASLALVANTPFRTAIGKVGIYEVRRSGHVELAGPVKVREAARLLGQLEALGAQRILVDGAADRRAFVACGVDAFVLATGRALEAQPEALAQATAAILGRLQLSAPPEAALPPEALRAAPAWRLAGQGWAPAPWSTWLVPAEELVEAWPEGVEALMAPGAVGDGLLQALLALPARQAPPSLVVPAGTHLLAEPQLWQRFLGRGGRAYALEPLLAAALTVNPTSPEAEELPSSALLAACRSAMPQLPVLDVLAPGQGAHA